MRAYHLLEANHGHESITSFRRINKNLLINDQEAEVLQTRI